MCAAGPGPPVSPPVVIFPHQWYKTNISIAPPYTPYNVHSKGNRLASQTAKQNPLWAAGDARTVLILMTSTCLLVYNVKVLYNLTGVGIPLRKKWSASTVPDPSLFHVFVLL